MGRLIDDIITFLESEGIGCRQEMRHGFELINAQLPEGKGSRLILPLEIKAASQEEAQVHSQSSEEAVRSIKAAEGYPLIIAEDRWESQKSMMRARLLAHLQIFTGVFARNCEVRKIEKSEAQTFLADNHSYGYAACKYHYGLYLKSMNQLIAVATFSNARRWIKDGAEIRSYEWTRYASLPGMRISGGMGKVLKAFINEVHPDDIMSYADLEWSEGHVYETLGFTLESLKAPVSFTVNPFTWKRKAIGKQIPDSSSSLYFRNFGSAKYRLKLTEYH